MQKSRLVIDGGLAVDINRMGCIHDQLVFCAAGYRLEKGHQLSPRAGIAAHNRPNPKDILFKIFGECFRLVMAIADQTSAGNGQQILGRQPGHGVIIAQIITANYVDKLSAYRVDVISGNIFFAAVKPRLQQHQIFSARAVKHTIGIVVNNSVKGVPNHLRVAGINIIKPRLRFHFSAFKQALNRHFFAQAGIARITNVNHHGRRKNTSPQNVFHRLFIIQLNQGFNWLAHGAAPFVF